MEEGLIDLDACFCHGAEEACHAVGLVCLKRGQLNRPVDSAWASIGTRSRPLTHREKARDETAMI